MKQFVRVSEALLLYACCGRGLLVSLSPSRIDTYMRTHTHTCRALINIVVCDRAETSGGCVTFQSRLRPHSVRMLAHVCQFESLCIRVQTSDGASSN